MNLEISNTEKNVNNNNFSKELNKYLEFENKLFSIDRFEGEFAVCENRETGEIINIEKNALPENIKEGSIIKYENGNFILDHNETTKKQAEIKNMVNNLFKKKE